MSNRIPSILMALTTAMCLTACKDNDSGSHGHDHGPDSHEHADQKADKKTDDHEHQHEEIDLGTFDVGGIKVTAAQGHGKVEAGKEGHLVVKLDYNDKGATTVRAWIGTEDRTLSAVGKGDYAASHDDYDIHAVAPEPLAEGTKWWVEIEKPDGAKVVGSIPLLKDVEKK